MESAVKKCVKYVEETVRAQAAAMSAAGMSESTIEAALLQEWSRQPLIMQTDPVAQPLERTKEKKTAARTFIDGLQRTEHNAELILALLDKEGKPSSYLVEKTGLSKVSVLAVLHNLVAQAKVVKVGEKRATIWRLA